MHSVVIVRPARLNETTPGMLTLRAEPPRFFPTWYTFYLPWAPPGSSEYVGPLDYQGTIRDFCLSLAAIHARPTSGRSPARR